MVTNSGSGTKKFREDNGAIWVRKDTDKDGKPRTMLSMMIDGVSYVAFENKPRDKDGKPRTRTDKEPNFRVYKSLKQGGGNTKVQRQEEVTEDSPF